MLRQARSSIWCKNAPRQIPSSSLLAAIILVNDTKDSGNLSHGTLSLSLLCDVAFSSPKADSTLVFIVPISTAASSPPRCSSQQSSWCPGISLFQAGCFKCSHGLICGRLDPSATALSAVSAVAMPTRRLGSQLLERLSCSLELWDI